MPQESLSAPQDPNAPATLRRVLGLWLLVFYGLGSIIGAGIYVLIGVVADAAGYAAPVAFVLAGVLAALTGLSYAELSAPYPEAAGAAAYVQEAFGKPWLSRAIGLAVVAVGIFLSSSLARGVVGYIDSFVTVPEMPVALGIIVFFTVVACLGVGFAMRLAAWMTIVEIGGLAIVIAAGGPALERLGEIAPLMMPDGLAGWSGVVAGAFFAFFAFLGFEDIVNMAEEAREPEKTLPRAIVLAIILSTAIYFVVTLIAVAAVPMETLAGSRAPLELVTQAVSWVPAGTLSAIAIIAIPNGILITLVMLGRIIYGMARRGWFPAALGAIHPVTRTPVRATVAAGIVVFVFTALVPFIGLVTLTSAVNLCVFGTVNLALMRLQRLHPRSDLAFAAKRWCPPLAAGICVALLVLEMLR